MTPTRLIWLATALICALTTALFGWLTINDRVDRIAAADRQAAELSRTLAEHAARAFGTVDVLLDALADRFEVEPSAALPSPQYLRRLFGEHRVKLPQINGIGYLDKDGRLYASSEVDAPPDMRITQADFFAVHANNADAGLFIGAPLHLRFGNRSGFPVSRRVTTADGGFGGVISALLDTSHFRTFYDRATAIDGEHVLLLRKDGTVLAASSNLETEQAWVGRRIDLAPSNEFADIGQLVVPGLSEHFNAAAVPGWPLIMLVSHPEVTTLALWGRQAWLQFGLLAVFLATLALFAHSMTRRLQRDAAISLKLEQANERYDRAVNAANAGVWEWSPEGNAIHVSERFCQMVGVSPAAAATTSGRWFKRIHPDDVAACREAFDRHLRDPACPYDVEYRLRDDSGEYRWLHSRGRAERDADGRVLRMTGSVEDVSKRKKADLALLESQAKLEQQAVILGRVADRLSQANGIAEAERRRAEEANRSKSAFLAMMSHELRTPLNAILGFSEMIRDAALGPDKIDTYREYAGYVHDGGSHLLSLINDILDLSKIEAGRMELHVEDIDAREMIEDCLALTRGMARERQVALRADTPPAGCLFTADRRATKQMVVNLLSNAIKFTPAGGTVVLMLTAGANGVLISVRDTGIGMSEADIERALEPFGQVDNSFTRGQQGTGLGLPMVKGLIELHGGRLAIASAPGRGTTATLCFPAERVELAA